MFNIKKIKDMIVTKTVTPSTMLAKVMAENIQLKQSLDSVYKEFDGSPIPLNKPSNGNKDIKETITQIESDRNTPDKQLIAKAKEIADDRKANVSADDRLMELDAKAVESQKAYRDNGNSFFVTANTIILPTGCSDRTLQKMIGRINNSRMNDGKKPYLTYKEYEAEQDKVQGVNPNSRYITIDHTSTIGINPKASKVAPQYIVSQKYYLMRESGVTFIYDNTKQPSDRKVLRLMKQPITDTPYNISGNGNSIIYSDPVNPLSNLSDSEHNQLIASKVSLKDLYQVYVNAENINNIQMNFAIAVNVF
jgi:hypothetical protein